MENTQERVGEQGTELKGSGCVKCIRGGILAAIVESSDDAIFSLTPDCRFTTWSRASERMFGYSAEEIRGRHVSLLLPPELRAEFFEHYGQIMSGRVIEHRESVRLTKSGERIHVSLTISPVLGPEGKLRGISAVVRNITARLRTEEELSVSRELCRQLAESIDEVFWMFEPATRRILYVSPAYEQIWGRSAASLRGDSSLWLETIHPEDRERVRDIKRRRMRGASVEIEYRIVRPNGEVRSIRDRAFPILDDNGEVTRIAGVAEDITARRQAEDALELSQSRLRRLADSGVIGVFEGSPDGRVLSGNDSFLRMLGYSREDLDAGRMRWDRMTVPGFETVNRRFREQLAEKGSADPAEIEFFRRDGSSQPSLIGLAALEGESEERAIGFMLDLTREKQATEALRASEELFRQLTENIREVFWMMDLAASRILYVSPAFEEVWGRAPESLYADPASWLDSIHADDKTLAEDVFRRQAKGEILDSEYRIVRPSGAVRWIRDRAFPVRDKAGNIVRLAGVAEDITERKFAELRLFQQARCDELTGLPNRRLFREKLRAVPNAGGGDRPGAVFFIGIDQLKLVNDTLGKAGGDRLLSEAAARLVAVCGEAATVARIGGDEFAVLAAGLEGLDPVRRLGRRMMACLETPFDLGGRQIFAGAGIGVSLLASGADPDALERDAAIAMHEAKRAGKCQIRFFTPEFAKAAGERLEMETRLREALALREFRLQYQPQFPAGSLSPSRFEALIRWYPPDGPPVPPLRFIPAAEQNGLIVPIGTWVLREACRRCVEWQREDGLGGVGVAVNVSAPQFACPDFVEVVERVLQLTGLAPRLLELELTESVFVQDVKESARTLTRLRDLGVTIALDDFGTGYSSLSYLQNLPIDALKIDRSFLTEIERRKGEAVLRCFMELAHALGLRVIGEGVETDSQLQLLTGLGCDEFQGFLLGRPAFEVSPGQVPVRKPLGQEVWNPALVPDHATLSGRVS